VDLSSPLPVCPLCAPGTTPHVLSPRRSSLTRNTLGAAGSAPAAQRYQAGSKQPRATSPAPRASSTRPLTHSPAHFRFGFLGGACEVGPGLAAGARGSPLITQPLTRASLSTPLRCPPVPLAEYPPPLFWRGRCLPPLDGVFLLLHLHVVRFRRGFPGPTWPRDSRGSTWPGYVNTRIITNTPSPADLQVALRLTHAFPTHPRPLLPTSRSPSG